MIGFLSFNSLITDIKLKKTDAKGSYKQVKCQPLEDCKKVL